MDRRNGFGPRAGARGATSRAAVNVGSQWQSEWRSAPKLPLGAASLSVEPCLGERPGTAYNQEFHLMEAMGARSNPCAPGLLPRLAALHASLQAENRGAATPRPVRGKSQPVLETILRILQEVDGPVHAREIHARAEE